MPTSDDTTFERIARTWRPAQAHGTEDLGPVPAAALSALFDLPETAAGAGAPLPPLWHWLHFLSWPRQSALGADGHVRDGHFMPPVPDRRRMFAGGRLTVDTPLTVGRPAQRSSRVSKVEPKRGRSGEMLFVTVRSDFHQDGRLCLTEEQDLVYRSGGDAPAPAALAPDTETRPRDDAPWQLAWLTSPTLLFRFSALTANSHRIHYDAPYTTGVEGFPGLVVHGPLLVLAMLELLRRRVPDRTVRTVAYRLRRPVFCGEHLLACGAPDGDGAARLRIASRREAEHATAEVTFG